MAKSKKRPSAAQLKAKATREHPARKLEQPFISRTYESEVQVVEAASQYTTIEGALRRRPYLVRDHRNQEHCYVIARTPGEAVEIFFNVYLEGKVHHVEMYDQSDPRPDMRLKIALLKQKIEDTDRIIVTLPDVQDDEKFTAFRTQLEITKSEAEVELAVLSSRYSKIENLTADQAIRENVRLIALDKQANL